MPKPITVTTDDFPGRVLDSELPVVVDFWAAWCGPCHMVAPVVEQLAVELDGQVVFAKLDVDHNPDLAREYGVEGIPTLIVFQNGDEIGRIIGFEPKQRFLGHLKEILPGLAEQTPQAA